MAYFEKRSDERGGADARNRGHFEGASFFDARLVHPKVRQAMRILENDQTQVPTTANLARRVLLSPAHLSRMFSSQLNETASSYGRRIRLDHSVNRLRYDPASIGEVALDFGYASQAAFTRAFHEQFGVSPREYMNRVASRQSVDRVPLPGPVRLVRRQPTPLAARRFFGTDHADFWRDFIDDLGDDLRHSASFIGLSYDDPRVTPARFQRYDCCVVLNGPWRRAMGKAGLDAIQLPGGLHGEVEATGEPGDLRSLITSLFTEWLPTRQSFAPEGDPLPIFFDKPPVGGPVGARVAIRVRERTSEPSPNLILLDGAALAKEVTKKGNFLKLA